MPPNHQSINIPATVRKSIHLTEPLAFQ